MGGNFSKHVSIPVNVHKSQIMFSARCMNQIFLFWMEHIRKVNEKGRQPRMLSSVKCAYSIKICRRHKNDVFMNDYKFMSYLLHSYTRK